MPSQNLNRILWVSLLLLIAVLAVQTRDNLEQFFAGVGRLDVTADADGDTVQLYWRGKIDAPMASRIQDAFDKHRGTAQRFVLSLSLPGGSLQHGGQVVALLRQIRRTHRLDTVIERNRRCASMCVPVYLQGQTRRAAESARFMFHEVSFREQFAEKDIDVPASAKQSATDRLFETYFTPAGVPDAWIRKVRADMSGGNDVWKTARELVDEDAAIVQDVF